MTFRKVVFYIVILVLLAIVGYTVFYKPSAVTPAGTTTTVVSTTITPATPSTEVINSTMYGCDGGSTIAASFSAANAALTLSDGRQLTLPQTVSADGGQYKSGNILFVTKGDQAFLQEKGNTTYDNCLAGLNNIVTNGRKTFTDQGNTFTLNYPQNFILSGGGIGYTQSWKANSDSTMGLLLAKIYVQKSFEPNTNFGDATLTVGTSSDPAAVQSCLGNSKSWTLVGGTPFATITSSDAGAGNRYDTTSYRIVRNNQCYAVEYTIHYSVLANYPAGTVSAFDEPKVRAALESIVQSFRFLS